jgi:hypothetical protein
MNAPEVLVRRHTNDIEYQGYHFSPSVVEVKIDSVSISNFKVETQAANNHRADANKPAQY